MRGRASRSGFGGACNRCDEVCMSLREFGAIYMKMDGCFYWESKRGNLA